MKTLMRFLQEENGATAMEYGLIVALISVATIGSMNGLGVSLNSTYNAMEAALTR